MLRGGDVSIDGICSLDDPRAGAIGYATAPAKLVGLATLPAALIVPTNESLEWPDGPALIAAKDPNAAFAAAGRHLYRSAKVAASISASASVDPSARLEPNVAIGANATIGANVEIGSGTEVAAGAVVGDGVRIGRDCAIGPNAVLTACLLGNRVEVQAGATIGEPGFGYVPGAEGIERVVQIGRVILQDDVHVGSNVCIDRGSIGDTVIGEGTKIGNLQQIAHNTRIGRHCIIVGNGGIAGSATIGDGVIIAGGVFVTDHSSIGSGATIAGVTLVKGSVPPGVTWGGIPARPVESYLRDLAEASARARRRSKGPRDRD